MITKIATKMAIPFPCRKLCTALCRIPTVLVLPPVVQNILQRAEAHKEKMKKSSYLKNIGPRFQIFGM